MGPLLVAAEQQHVGRTGLGHGVQDGQRRGARTADDHGLPREGDAGPLQIGHAALAVGVVGDERAALVHEHVGPVGEARRGGPHIGGGEGLGLIGGRDVNGQKVAGRQEGLGLGPGRQIGRAVVPGQPCPLVDGVVHDGRLRVGNGMPQNIEMLGHSRAPFTPIPTMRENPHQLEHRRRPARRRLGAYARPAPACGLPE